MTGGVDRDAQPAASGGLRAAARRRGGWVWWWAVAAAGAALPWLFPSIAHRNLLVLVGINAILVTSLDLLIGYAGLLSLGHAGFWGIGAYTSAALVADYGAPFPLALLAAGALAAACGLFIGYPSLRLRSHYFVLVTFITGIVITLLLTSLVGLTRGAMGLPGIPFATLSLPRVFTYTFNTFRSKVGYYYLVLACLLGALALKEWVGRSRMGRALVALREDEDLAAAVGIDTHRYKLLAFGMSTAMAGIAGSLYAHYTTFLSPDGFTFVTSFDLFVMDMVGGAGTAAGPLIGPALLTTLRDLLRSISPVLAEIVFGVFLIVTIAFFPAGLVGAWRALRAGRAWSRP